jgi:hypothetical protein
MIRHQGVGWGLFAAWLALSSGAPVKANTIFFSGNLRTSATVADCGPGRTLGAGSLVAIKTGGFEFISAGLTITGYLVDLSQ